LECRNIAASKIKKIKAALNALPDALAIGKNFLAKG